MKRFTTIFTIAALAAAMTTTASAETLEVSAEVTAFPIESVSAEADTITTTEAEIIDEVVVPIESVSTEAETTEAVYLPDPVETESPDTGVGGLAALAGVAVLTAGSLILSKKK